MASLEEVDYSAASPAAPALTDLGQVDRHVRQQGRTLRRHSQAAARSEPGAEWVWWHQPGAGRRQRTEPAVFGHVASDPTVSLLIDALAADAQAALKVIDTARAAARAQAWTLAGPAAPNHETVGEGAPGHRRGRDPGHRAFGKGDGRSKMQAGLRLSPFGAWADHGNCSLIGLFGVVLTALPR